MGWTYRLEFENDTTCLEEDLIALVGNNSIPFNPDITGLGVLLLNANMFTQLIVVRYWLDFL